jgi:hypothetical protein
MARGQQAGVLPGWDTVRDQARAVAPMPRMELVDFESKTGTSVHGKL